MVADFIESALIIDDKPREVIGLKHILEEKGVSVSFYIPSRIEKCTTELKNRKIIFLDLYLDPNITDLNGNISKIRKLLETKIGKSFGSYGIILWSAHTEEIDKLQGKINLDKEKYTLPLFIVGLDKTHYIKASNFSTLFDDIDNVLTNNKAATFFLEWSNSVKQAENSTVSKIYSLMPDYKTLSDDFTVILKKLALNHTGIDENIVETYPLHRDAFKSFDDILHAELINCQKSETNLFSATTPDFSKKEDLPKIYAQLNTAILIDENIVDKKTVVSGNVYKIKNARNKFKCSVIGDKIKEITTKLEAETDKNKKVNLESEKQILENVKYIAIEITPPCDFSNNKRVKSRLVGGILIDAQMVFDNKKQKYTINKQIENLGLKPEYFYKEVFPLQVKNIANYQLLFLDFRYFGDEDEANLQNTSEYEMIFRTKPKLFADILQKFSSHAARLGLFVIHS